MLFNSYEFIFIMLPISIIGYYALNRTKHFELALAYLLAISWCFVGYTNIVYLYILIPSILLNYVLARAINSELRKKGGKRRELMILGICFDVIILVIFKYYDFFVTSMNHNFKTDIPTLKLLLPLGISFYTFQQISYLVDCYRDSSIRYSFLEYSLFISFYPQFVQGPIILQNELIPQFLDDKRRAVDYEYMSKGVYRFVLGLSKKVLLADNLAFVVNGGYENIDSLSSLSAILVILAYTLQIYFDFSGYSDMAIGLGWMFHFDFPENFDSPYKAVSIDDFWDRWHITLTRFFTQYIYIPMGGSRRGVERTYANIFFIFLISGLWHGAEWSFILWGILHGFAMIVSRAMRERGIRINRIISYAVTFTYVAIAWVFFRATDIAEGVKVLGKLFLRRGKGIDKYLYEGIEDTVEGALLCHFDILGFNDAFPGALVLLFLLSLVCICIFCKNTKERAFEWKPSIQKGIVTVVLGLWCVLSLSGVTNYIYWNF